MITNALGQVVISGPYESQINVAGLREGLYFVRVFDREKKYVFTSKLIISR